MAKVRQEKQLQIQDQLEGSSDNNQNGDQADNKVDNQVGLIEAAENYNQASMISKRVTIAGGFLDFALFTANVEHLKFVIETGPDDVSHYTMLLWLLFISLGLQVFALFS